MAIIIDANCLINVFDETSSLHNEFSPVLNWIINGKGKIVAGGTKYLEELSKLPRILRVFNILKKYKNKVVILDKKVVDLEQNRIEKMIVDPDFDDPHIMALVIVSSCRLFCSLDSRSEKYLLDSRFYPKGIKPPKYYKGSKNTNLLCDKYIPERYKPSLKLNKEERKIIPKL